MSVENASIIGFDTQEQKFDIASQDLLEFIKVVNNAVWIVDIDLHIIAQNDAAQKLTGWSIEELVRHSIEVLIPKTDTIFFKLRQIFDQTAKQSQIVSFDNGFLLTRNKDRPISVSGKAMPIIQNDQLVGAICLFWEIHPGRSEDYVRYEFANMASHLFRTPLSFIQASVDFLMSSDLEVGERRAILEKIKIQNNRLIKFTNQLLAILRLKSEEPATYIEAVKLVPLISRVIDLVQDENPRHIVKFVNKSNLQLVINADPIKIELILLNLLLNAVRRCPNGGRIIVQVQTDNQYATISIIDNGEFIPAKQAERMFWQFYPVDDDFDKMPSTYKLGLYNVKRLVEVQNGHVWVKSQRGRNSEFSFSIPVWEQETNEKGTIN